MQINGVTVNALSRSCSLHHLKRFFCWARWVFVRDSSSCVMLGVIRVRFATEVELQDAVNPRSEVCSLPVQLGQFVISWLLIVSSRQGKSIAGDVTRVPRLGWRIWVSRPGFIYDFRAWSRPGTT